MPNRCTFCTIIKPTNHLILGTTWYECCEPCGDIEMLARIHNGELETKTIREIFDGAAQDRLKQERTGS